MNNETLLKNHEGQSQKLPTVVIFEDADSWYDVLPEYIGMYPALIIKTFEEGDAFLSEQASLTPEQRMPIGGFIIDGNLSEQATGGIEGRKLHDKIRQDPFYDQVPTIGNPGSTPLTGADYNLNKNDRLLDQLLTWIEAGRKT